MAAPRVLQAPRQQLQVCEAASLQFIKGVNESTVPDVSLRRARTGTSGQAMFTFENPSIFQASSELGDITGEEQQGGGVRGTTGPLMHTLEPPVPGWRLVVVCDNPPHYQQALQPEINPGTPTTSMHRLCKLGQARLSPPSPHFLCRSVHD